MLNAIGLNEKEAKVYLSTFALGEALASSIAKRANLKRPTTYVVLTELEKRGIVSHLTKKKTRYYRAMHPEVLYETHRRRLEGLKHALPSLIKLRSSTDVQPEIAVYQGQDACGTMLLDMLKEGGDILWWGDEIEADKKLGSFFDEYTKKRIAKGIWSYGICSTSDRAEELQKNDAEMLREIILVPHNSFSARYDIHVYGNKVNFLSYDDLVGIVIENAHIAESMRATFRLLHEQARLNEHSLLTDKEKKYLQDH